MISLILLASGFSRRYGSNKLMAEIDGQKMYLHILKKLKNITANEKLVESAQVIVVSQYEEILKRAEELGFAAVTNSEAEEGIAASVRKGIEKAGNSNWYFFFTADQPYLHGSSIISFINTVLNQEKSLATVHAQMTPGNPTAFQCKWKEQLLSLSGDVGGRKVLKQNPEEVFWYEIGKEEIRDIDYCTDDIHTVSK